MPQILLELSSIRRAILKDLDSFAVSRVVLVLTNVLVSECTDKHSIARSDTMVKITIVHDMRVIYLGSHTILISIIKIALKVDILMPFFNIGFSNNWLFVERFKNVLTQNLILGPTIDFFCISNVVVGYIEVVDRFATHTDLLLSYPVAEEFLIKL